MRILAKNYLQNGMDKIRRIILDVNPCVMLLPVSFVLGSPILDRIP
jgi:hypothetical protein